MRYTEMQVHILEAACRRGNGVRMLDRLLRVYRDDARLVRRFRIIRAQMQAKRSLDGVSLALFDLWAFSIKVS